MEAEAFQVNKRSLAGEAYDYVFADGLWISSLGALTKAKKDRVVLAVLGYSKEKKESSFLGFLIREAESAEAWKELWGELKQRGFDIGSAKLVAADDGGGLLSALEDIAPSVPVQVCIAHRYRNVL